MSLSISVLIDRLIGLFYGLRLRCRVIVSPVVNRVGLVMASCPTSTPVHTSPGYGVS